jgi:hypothetical protein
MVRCVGLQVDHRSSRGFACWLPTSSKAPLSGVNRIKARYMDSESIERWLADMQFRRSICGSCFALRVRN